METIIKTHKKMTAGCGARNEKGKPINLVRHMWGDTVDKVMKAYKKAKANRLKQTA